MYSHSLFAPTPTRDRTQVRAFHPLLELLEGRALPGDATGWALLSPLALFADPVAPPAAVVGRAALSGGLAAEAATPALQAPAAGSAERSANPVHLADVDGVIAAPAGESLYVVAARLGGPGGSIQAVALRATYLFNDTLDPEQAEAPALLSIDPWGANQFETEFVYGQERQVFHYYGASLPPEWNAGLALDTTDLIPASDYSVELVFRFLDEPPTWGRILDVQNRTSDNGFYVNPSNRLQIWENGALADGPTDFTTGVFHHVVLTNSASKVSVYLDGSLEFITPKTSVMNVNNPENVMNFFQDDYVVEGEYTSGQVALVRVYEGALAADEVAQLAKDPFAFP